MLANQSLTDVLDAFSSSAPTPGGGSAAALAGAIGASLLAMVAALPKTKNNTPEERAALEAARATILQLRSQLVELIDRDAAAYDAVVAAYRLPKATDDEKAARKTSIQDALKLATEVPLETYLAVNNVMREAAAVAEAGNPSAKSDLAVALQLIGTAGQGALLNIEANLGSVTDQAFVQNVVARVKESFEGSRMTMMRIAETAGLAELHKQLSTRFDLHHGHGEPPRDFWIKGAVEMLTRLNSIDSRRALEALSESAEEMMARSAKQALLKLQGGQPDAPHGLK
jgi:methenyltetrahydrofolate cyclohydrolase